MLLEEGYKLIPVEIKAGYTIPSNYFSSITYWSQLAETDPQNNYIVYPGNDKQVRAQGMVVSWRDIADTIPTLSKKRQSILFEGDQICYSKYYCLMF